MTPREFLSALAEAGYQDILGVPCSTLSGVYSAFPAERRLRYLAAPHEGIALATACGLWLAGRRPALLMQNSGFGNRLTPLASLAMPYRIPVVTFMTMRGWPAADNSEAQHAVMGRSAFGLIEALGMACRRLPADPAAAAAILAEVASDTADGRPAFVLIMPGSIAAGRGDSAPPGDLGLSRATAVRLLASQCDGTAVITTIGNISRELFAAADRPLNLYVQGAMGHAISVASGTALGQPGRRVVAIDGDGSAVMHLGAISLAGSLGQPNLAHVILDNGVYESTGGQPTAAAATDLPAVALACGYRQAVTVSTEAGLRAQAPLLTAPGPVLLHVRITPGGGSPGGRATEKIGPAELTRRFRAAVAAEGGPP
jgi:phosphonopyruvate decarboxylase